MRHTNPDSKSGLSYNETLEVILEMLDVELFICFDAGAFLTHVKGMETDPDGDIKRLDSVEIIFKPRNTLFHKYSSLDIDILEARLSKIRKRTTEENYTKLAFLQRSLIGIHPNLRGYELELERKEPTTKKDDNWSGGLDLLRSLW